MLVMNSLSSWFSVKSKIIWNCNTLLQKYDFVFDDDDGDDDDDDDDDDI